MDRSFFLKAMGVLGVAPAVVAKSAAFNPMMKNDPDDWIALRKHFSYPLDYYYFNTGGIGAVPLFTRQAVREAWDANEKYPKPGHDLKDWMSVKSEIGKLVGVEKPTELALTGSTTEGLNIILNGLSFDSRDEIITSTHEHPALHVPLINLAKRKGIVVKSFEPDLARGIGNVERISDLISKKTRLIILSMVTCTTGQLLPVHEIIELAHSRGILVALDGAQTTGQVEINLDELGADFYASGGQKWLLGPKRTGFLYVRPDALNLLTPQTVGAYSDQGYNLSEASLSWSEGSSRFEYATQNESLFYGLKSSVGFFNQLSMKDVVNHNRSLAEYFVGRLSDISQIELVSPAEEKYRTSIISISHESMNYRDLANALSKKRCRVRVVFEGGMEAVRVSLHLYNSKSDVDHLVASLNDIA